jgi:Outer membrane protein beta-barrel domain
VRPGCAAPIALAALLLAVVPAGAQTGESRVDVGVGVHWLGAISFAPVTATETALGNAKYTLFKSESTLQGASGIEGRVGVRLTSMLRAEGTFFYSRPNLQTRLSSDVEGIPDITVSEQISQYIVEGGVTAQLARWAVGRLTPFASAGGGYLRQLHDGRGLVETGRTYYVGAGVRYPFTMPGRGLMKSSGIRADVKAEFLKNGVALDEDTHAVPSLSASFFVSF